MVARATKRPRSSPSGDVEETFGRGSIRRVVMHNFMTYTDCWFSPGSHLNLLIGPNGSGKSTIVCALCIGLAASPKLLGRADNVKDFVKRGERNGWVEVHVQKSEDKVVTIKRTLCKESNSSSWLIDGRNAGLRQVQDLVKDLNVQIENLCQFLPQDKVVSFAKLSPEELLRETERAISTSAEGDDSLYQRHCRLIDQQSESVSLTKLIQTRRQKLEFLEAQRADIERDVEKVKRKKKLEEEREWAQKKLKWVEYNECKEVYLECKAALVSAKEKHKEKEKAYKQRERECNKQEREVGKLEGKAKEALAEVKKKTGALTKAQGKTENLFQQTDVIEREMNSFSSEKKRHEQSIRAVEQELDRAVRELEHWQERDRRGESDFNSGHQAELDQVKQRLQETHEDHVACRRSLDKAKREAAKQKLILEKIGHKLNSFTDDAAQRINAVQRHSPHMRIVAAKQWIDQNQNRLRGRVYGPLAAEVQIPNDQNAIYLENQVPQWCWQSFVTSYPEDRDLLQRELNSNRRYNINFMYTPSSGPLPHPHGNATDYAGLDIKHTLDETFEAPAVVKNALKDVGAINLAYIGTSYTQTQIEQAAQRNITPQWRTTRIGQLWTPESKYTKLKSRYDGFESLRTSAVRPSRFLVQGGGQGGAQQAQEKAQLQRQEQDLQRQEQENGQAIRELEQRMAQLDSDLNRLNSKKKELSDLKNKTKKKINQCQVLVNQRTRELKTLKKKSYTREEEDKLAADRLQSIQDQARSVVACVSAFASLADRHFASVPVHMEHEVAKDRVNALRSGLRHEKDTVNEAANLVDAVQEEFHRNKERLAKSKKEAEEAQKLTDEAKAKFDAFPTNRDELEEAIIDLESKIKSLMITDPNILDEYNDILAKIEDLGKKLAGEVEDFENYESNRKKQEEAWLAPLQEVVARVNEKFAMLFADLGFAGEVRLMPSDGGYDKYRLEIHVKFHDKDDLQILTSTVQSGGERSVSTIIFLIALQQLTPCPFRVIDEINQGMDPTNERLVFKKLVEEACIPGSPQCFLLTPKLLPSLHYSDEVTVLNIFNGPFLNLSGEFRFL